MSYSRQTRRAAARKAAKEQVRQARQEQANASYPAIGRPLPSWAPTFDDLPAIEDITAADIDRFLAEQEIEMRSWPEPAQPANPAPKSPSTDASSTGPTDRTGPTGPRTKAGKAKSSMNNLRHGLTGKFLVLDHESQDEFDQLRAALIDEHQPVSATEEILVQRLAEHYWLSRRAQNLQDAAIIANSPHNLALFLRYQTTNDRAFHKCLSELSKLKKDRRKSRNEFESQSAPQPQQFVSQNSQEDEKKHNSAMVAELRKLIGEDYPTSDATLLNIIQRQMLDLCGKMEEKAAA